MVFAGFTAIFPRKENIAPVIGSSPKYPSKPLYGMPSLAHYSFTIGCIFGYRLCAAPGNMWCSIW